jgi:predicted outer membrane repeat protein
LFFLFHIIKYQSEGGLLGKTVVLFLVGVCVTIYPVHAKVWYVHPDSALSVIQDALSLCADHDTVLVAPGTYYENLVWPYIQGIDLLSKEGPDETIIDGNAVDRVIQMRSTADTSTKISGFTIRNGNTVAFGGGIFCDYGAAPLISNNVITGNRAGSNGGGGIYCTGSTVITDNIISDNVAYLITWFSTGGGIYCDGSPTITDNVISGNIADHAGGVFCMGTAPVISGNTISNNRAFLDGGGIYCWNCMPAIVHNKIVDNIAGCGGGVYCEAAAPLIDSCTISGNTNDGIHCMAESHPVIHHSNITGNSGYGINNVDDTAFVHAEYNWWGHSTGPYHPDSNPAGFGDAVSDYVAFFPWLEHAVGVVEEETVEMEPRAFGATIIRGPLLLPAGKDYRIYDITGRTVAPERMRPGIYFVEVDGEITQKVVKVR